MFMVHTCSCYWKVHVTNSKISKNNYLGHDTQFLCFCCKHVYGKWLTLKCKWNSMDLPNLYITFLARKENENDFV